MIKKLAVGTELWRYAGLAQFRYKVIGTREYADSTLYEVECLSCKHGDSCRVLIAYDDCGLLQTVHMLNEDDQASLEHSSWHATDQLYATPYCTSENEARWQRLTMAVRQARDRAVTACEAAARAIREREHATSSLAELEHALDLLANAETEK